MPVAIIAFVPAYFATDWSVMARIDIGQVLLVIAALRILDGVIRIARAYLARAWASGSSPSESASGSASGSARAITAA